MFIDTTPSTVAEVEHGTAFRDEVRRALAGFLAGYSGTTVEAYRLDIRQWLAWLDTLNTDVYRYCTQERLIEHNPAAHVRRPKLDYESTTLGLDRNELGAFLVQAGLSGGRDHALACLLALNGLRISEALNADLDDLDVTRGHRTFVHPSQGEQDRHHPALPKAAGIDKRISPHSLRHGFITAALDAGVPLHDVQEAASHSDPRTTMSYDRGRGSLDRHATYIVSTFVAGASR